MIMDFSPLSVVGSAMVAVIPGAGVRLGRQQFLKAQTPMTKAWAFNQYEKAWLGGPHPSSAGSGRDWLDGHHHPSPWRVENQAAAYGAGWATTTPPGPPFARGGKMIMSYRYPAGSGRSWLGDHHPPWPPLCKGGTNDHVLSLPSGERAELVGRPPPPLAPPLQGGEK